MRHIIIILCLFILSSCNQDKNIKHKAKKDSIPAHEVRIRIENNDKLILLSQDKQWSKTFEINEENQFIWKNIEPSIAIDREEQVIYFNFFDIYLYKIDLINGNVLDKINLNYLLVNGCGSSNKLDIFVENQYVFIYYRKQLLLFDNKLNLISNFSRRLEKEELERFDLVIKDTVLVDKISSSSSVLFSDDYYLDTIKCDFISKKIIVEYKFINSKTLHDTVLIVSEFLK